MNKTKGFTLIEIITFIVVMTIIASILLIASITVLKNQPLAHQQMIANKTATRCLDWFFGQRKINGFSSIACSSSMTTPSFCAAPANYSVNVSCSLTNSSNYKTITVSVSGPANATSSLLLANY
jgi:type II secretory pathway pseudopilin PulG